MREVISPGIKDTMKRNESYRNISQLLHIRPCLLQYTGNLR